MRCMVRNTGAINHLLQYGHGSKMTLRNFLKNKGDIVISKKSICALEAEVCALYHFVYSACTFMQFVHMFYVYFRMFHHIR